MDFFSGVQPKIKELSRALPHGTHEGLCPRTFIWAHEPHAARHFTHSVQKYYGLFKHPINLSSCSCHCSINLVNCRYYTLHHNMTNITSGCAADQGDISCN